MRSLFIIFFMVTLGLVTSCSSVSKNQKIAYKYFTDVENRNEVAPICEILFPPSSIYVPGDTIFRTRSEVVLVEREVSREVEIECPPSEVKTLIKKEVSYQTVDSIVYKYRDVFKTDTIRLTTTAGSQVLINQINQLEAKIYKKDIEMANLKEEKESAESRNDNLWIALIVLVGGPVLYKVVKFVT